MGGPRRRWIAEGKSLRGENEMEWDSDRHGEMDTESKTVWGRKFDMKSKACACVCEWVEMKERC